MTHFAEYKKELSTSHLFKGGWTASRMGLLPGTNWMSLSCGCFGVTQEMYGRLSQVTLVTPFDSDML